MNKVGLPYLALRKYSDLLWAIIFIKYTSKIYREAWMSKHYEKYKIPVIKELFVGKRFSHRKSDVLWEETVFSNCQFARLRAFTTNLYQTSSFTDHYECSLCYSWTINWIKWLFIIFHIQILVKILVEWNICFLKNKVKVLILGQGTRC